MKILNAKYFYIPVAAFTLILVAVLIYISSISDRIIFPNLENYNYNYYTDQANSGNSEMQEYTVSDTLIHFKFQLNDQFYSPYVGLILSPKNMGTINVAKYNQISITISGKNIERIGISLYTPPLDPEQSSDETLYHSYLGVSDQKIQYNVPLSQFQFPDWWVDLHQLEEDKKHTLDLKNLLHINIGTAFSPEIKAPKTIDIFQIAFTRDNKELFLMIGIGYFVLVLLILSLNYFILKRKEKEKEIVVEYKSLDIEDINSSEARCLEFINSNYSESSLTLEKIAEETATTPRRVAKIISNKFNCNFKTYLNRIRLNEAKRLLLESNLNIGEISYKVGFNNQSHFNRVFKAETGKNPSEYRENQS
ncbi:helix-turn-helix domain-containing protein [Maribellus mangrovi]|uniref:helix-turn-helix domain-containing protein n=1 Tax=Maribellus mangrovi TaxID=3133146 RepID=UPI0030EE2724